MIAEPPSLSGADHDTTAAASPATALTEIGAVGAVVRGPLHTIGFWTPVDVYHLSAAVSIPATVAPGASGVPAPSVAPNAVVMVMSPDELACTYQSV